MKVWVGTGVVADEVEIFFLDKPEQWAGYGDLGHGWWRGHGNVMAVGREEASKEFMTLPTHGTRELIEFEISGNGRRV